MRKNDKGLCMLNDILYTIHSFGREWGLLLAKRKAVIIIYKRARDKKRQSKECLIHVLCL